MAQRWNRPGNFLLKSIGRPKAEFPNDLDSSPFYLFNANGTLIFGGVNFEVNKYALWKSDGTSEGTILIKRVRPGNFAPQNDHPYWQLNNNPYYCFGADNTVYFQGTDSEGSLLFDLWRTDLTETGTLRLTDTKFVPGSGPEAWTDLDDMLYFFAYDGIQGRQLWRSDDSEEGTAMVKALPKYLPWSGLEPLKILNRKMLMRAADAHVYDKWRLWASDGTESGTMQLCEAELFPARPVHDDLQVGNIWFFLVKNASSGIELWRTDGVASGTFMLKHFSGWKPTVGLDMITEINGKLLFLAEDRIHGREPWVTDGTASGTLLLDIFPGSQSSDPKSFLKKDGLIYFAANDRIHGREIWQTDGTPDGTHLIDSRAGTFGPNLELVSEVNNLLLFCVDHGTKGRALWATDTTSGGTRRLISNLNGKYETFSRVQNSIFFLENKKVLWRTDGTPEGTIKLAESTGDRYIYPRHKAGDNLFFFEKKDSLPFSEALWCSDGSIQGTYILVNDDPIPIEGPVEHYYACQKIENEDTLELWRTDKQNGRKRVKVFNSKLRRLEFWRVVGDYLYFSSFDNDHGRELWRTDGTEEGTIMLADVHPGPLSSTPLYIYDLDGILYFSAINDLFGRELWQTDGTPAGTFMIGDIAPGPLHSDPALMLKAGSRLFFTATDLVKHGQEPWSIPFKSSQAEHWPLYH